MNPFSSHRLPRWAEHLLEANKSRGSAGQSGSGSIVQYDRSPYRRCRRDPFVWSYRLRVDRLRPLRVLRRRRPPNGPVDKLARRATRSYSPIRIMFEIPRTIASSELRSTNASPGVTSAINTERRNGSSLGGGTRSSRTSESFREMSVSLSSLSVSPTVVRSAFQRRKSVLINSACEWTSCRVL
jgi:hypothetical protein